MMSKPVFSQKEEALSALEKIVDNFHEVAPGIYRSGLISEEAAPHLKELGVKTVINFDNKEKRARKEIANLELSGIYTIWIPWSGWEEPEDRHMDTFLALMKTESLKPILIHCKKGSERTGLAIGLWRVAALGWPAEKAYEEMRSYGYRTSLWGHFKRYLYRFARKRGEQEAKFETKFERGRVKSLYFLYQLRKLNPFRGDIPEPEIGSPET